MDRNSRCGHHLRLAHAALEPTAQASLWLSVLVVAVLFGWGAWQRRWIADDGLIVLRTVRNLLAGNGPVFNMGERVEVNTSTLWTYLLYLGGLVGGPVRLEYVALAAVAGAVTGRRGVRDAGRRPALCAEPAGPSRNSAAGRCAGLHRGAAGA